MTIKKKKPAVKRTPAVKKPTPIKKKVKPPEANIPNETPNDVQTVVNGAILQANAIVEMAALVRGSLFAADGTPILSGVINNQILIGQQMTTLLSANYVKIEQYNELNRNYTNLYNSFKALEAQASHLKQQNDSLTSALHGRTSQQPLIV